MTPQPLYVRVSDAPKVFSVSTDTLYKWDKQGRIRIFKRGGISLVKVAEIAAYIESSDE